MVNTTKKIKIGNKVIGGNSPILVQSMCNTLTKDARQTINQIHELEDAGCEIIRVSVPDKKSLNALKEIKDNISIPLVADIHFNHKLAVDSARYADKLRINPGNIGSKENVLAVIKAAKDSNIPIRIGVNLASIEKDLLAYKNKAEAMVESALRRIKIFENADFYDVVLSLKASDIKTTIDAYKLVSEKTDYPLHIGITEAGTSFSGTIKSSIGLGHLLLNNIGDTIRVSLSAHPAEEVRVGFEILKSLGLRKHGVTITSCPTCARAHIDIIVLSKKLEELTSSIKKPVHIALMGCEVNGPGESVKADIGISGGKPKSVLYKNGKILKKVDEKDIIDSVLKEIS